MLFTDIASRVSFLTRTTVTSYTAANLTLAVNRALERVGSLINKADSRWEFDDNNYGDLPFATLTITDGQQQYSLATSSLTVNRIEIKDSSGNWKRIIQIDQQTLKRGGATSPASGRLGGLSDTETALALGETTPSTGRSGAYQATPGTPTEYDLIGRRLFLFPVPNYTQTKSIRIYFNRGPRLVTYSSYTALTWSDDASDASSASPGFNSLYHDLVAQWAAYDYERNFKKDNSRLAEILQMEKTMEEDYGNRNRDVINRLIPNQDSNK